MASVTKFRTISAVNDQRFQLVNSNFARPWDTVAIGTGWTKIRIACRFSILDSGSNVTSTPRFAIGICSGSTNIFQDATTTHFLGIMSNNATWSRIVGPPVGYNIGASGTWVVTKRIGAVTTSNTSIGGLVNSTFYDATTANRTAFFITITKGSPTFTVQIFTRSAATASDVALAEFLTQVVQSLPIKGLSGSDIGDIMKIIGEAIADVPIFGQGLAGFRNTILAANNGMREGLTFSAVAIK